MSDLIRNFSDDFSTIVRRQPDAPAFIITRDIDAKTISYGVLSDYIDQTLSLLSGRYKLKSGDTVIGLMPNAAETLVLFLACLKGGIGYAPLPCTATSREIETWKGLVDPAACFLGEAIQDDKKQALHALGMPVCEITCDSTFSWLADVNTVGHAIAQGKTSYIYLSTSGTTGTSKAMVLEGNTLWSSGAAFMKYMGLDGQPSRFWNYLPMSYLGGLFNLGLIPLCTGSSIVIDEPFSGKTFLQFWPMIERHDIKTVWFVPSIIRGLLKIAQRNTSEELKEKGRKIEAAFLGTAPIDLQTKEKFEDLFGITVFENFALSETTFFSTETRETIGERQEGSVGNIIPYTDVRLIDSTEADDEDEGIKEIQVKSPFLFRGYIGADGIIQSSLTGDGYLPTGDLGFLTDTGTLVIKGRRRDIIKKGGYFVGLREVEILAESHPAVMEAAAVKVSHDFYGETYHLYLILKEEKTEEVVHAVQKYIHDNLIQYKWPEYIFFSKEFPRTASGKIRKHLLNQKEYAL